MVEDKPYRDRADFCLIHDSMNTLVALSPAANSDLPVSLWANRPCVVPAARFIDLDSFTKAVEHRSAAPFHVSYSNSGHLVW